MGMVFVLILLIVVLAVAVVGGVISLVTYLGDHLIREFRLSWAHRKARLISPTEGQTWVQDGDDELAIYVKKVYPDGRLVLCETNPEYNQGAVCWVDTPEGWSQRFNQRRLVPREFIS